MKITKNDFCYFTTEQDLTFGEQITLDGELLIPISALDKIKAEIEETIESYVCDIEENTMKAQGMLNAMRMTFEIIDKYKDKEKKKNERLQKIH